MARRSAVRAKTRRRISVQMSPREKILEVAEVMIDRYGPVDFQLQDVSNRIGVKPPAIYNHFEGRDDLVAQVALKGSREIWGLVRARNPGESYLSVLRGFTRRLVAYYVEHPAMARLALWELCRGGVAGWEDSLTIDRDMLSRSRRGFERAQRAGEIRDIPFDEFASLYMSGVPAAVLWSGFDLTVERRRLKELQEQAEDWLLHLLSPDRSTSR